MSASQTMKLLWINQAAVSASEGGGTRHVELARELNVMGWDVTVVASDFHLHRRRYTRREDGRDPVWKEEGGVRFCYLWAAAYSRNNYRRIFNWVSFLWSILASRKRFGQPDVVIGSSPNLPAALGGYLLAKSRGVPFVFEVRDLWPESILAVGGKEGLAYKALGKLADFLYTRAVLILVLAEGTQGYLVAEKGIASSKIVFVPNGVDPGAFVPALIDQGFPRTLVYAGAHGPANGLDTVIEAAAELRDDERFRFLLVGDGPVKKSLQKTAAERGLTNLEFRDPISKHEISGLLAGAHAGLMILKDSDLFAFGVSPNKLFDYMAASLPSICNVGGEVERLLADAGSGFQTNGPTAPALVEAIRAFGDTSTAELRVLGENGRAWVSENRSRRKVATDLRNGILRMHEVGAS